MVKALSYMFRWWLMGVNEINVQQVLVTRKKSQEVASVMT